MAQALHYGPTAKLLHWVIAALLAIQLALGWLMPDIHRGMTPGTAMSLHISIGMLILLLIAARFLWRLSHPVAPESTLPGWQRASSELVHWMLYVVVLLMTLSGWFFASARGWMVNLFGLVPLPHLVAENSPFGRSLGNWHETLSWALLLLVGVHVAAALLHLLVYKDHVMSRMLPR
jgi:cytochrome b561